MYRKSFSSFVIFFAMALLLINQVNAINLEALKYRQWRKLMELKNDQDIRTKSKFLGAGDIDGWRFGDSIDINGNDDDADDDDIQLLSKPNPNLILEKIHKKLI